MAKTFYKFLETIRQPVALGKKKEGASGSIGDINVRQMDKNRRLSDVFFRGTDEL